ncbi:MAG TPA: glycosyltransferase family 39 protein [Acidimicrobiales bacterium]|nr:glycosyltransferase family 39 protein [Acidimicrobiales bacterium]
MPATSGAARPLAHFRPRGTRLLAGGLLVIFALALLLRLLEAARSYDIFVDEISYTNIAINLANGHGLVLYGEPFALHPPAGFAVLAVVVKLFGLHGGTESTLYALRSVTALAGALVPAAIAFVVSRAAPWWAAVAAGLVVALDPFAILYDSRVMLEPLAQAPTAGMVACLAVACRRPASRPNWLALMGAGVLAATALSTKETFGLVVLATLVVLLLTQLVVPRRQALLVLATAVAGYGICAGLTIASMGWAPWWSAQSSDVLRGVGSKQVTGFNAPTTHVSLLSRAFADGSQFAMTYLVLAFGSLAAALLLWRLRPWTRAGDPGAHRAASAVPGPVGALLAIWGLCAAAYLAYATLFGTIEEQMYYIALAPATACLCLLVAGVRPSAWQWKRAGVAVLLSALLVFDATVWAVVHTRPDDEYRVFLKWEAKHVAAGSVISATENTGEFLIHNAVLGQWVTLAALRRHKVDYVLLSTLLVAQGYAVGSPAFFHLVEHRGVLVFSVAGPTDGKLQLYDVRELWKRSEVGKKRPPRLAQPRKPSPLLRYRKVGVGVAPRSASGTPQG